DPLAAEQLERRELAADDVADDQARHEHRDERHEQLQPCVQFHARIVARLLGLVPDARLVPRSAAMRRIALAALLAVTGCNWVFGLEPTVSGDAGDSELPPGGRSKLVWAIATTDGTPAPPALDPTIEYRPIGSEERHPELPIIQVGNDDGLVEVAYD